MNTLKKVLLSVAATMCICIVLLIVACIPRQAIYENTLISANYFANRQPFEPLLDDYINSIQDNFSDTLLCDISYCIDERHPFKSVIQAKYTQGEMQQAYEGLLSAVNDAEAPNMEYGRYWHGSLVLIRPLLLIMPIDKIRILCGITICTIQLVIIVMLIRRKNIAFACCYLIAFILIHPWMLFTSLEYGTAFLAASVASLVMVLGQDRSTARLMAFFAITGVITCFVDFLTTETLTFTMPMLLFLANKAQKEKNESPINRRNAKKDQTVGKIKVNCMLVIYSGLCWFAGYLGMFVMKIILLTVVAGKDTMITSLQEGLFRLGGDVRKSNVSSSQTVDFARRLSGAIWHNLACLYPTHAGVMEAGGVWLTTGLILIAGLILVYLLHDRIELQIVIPMVMIALVPFMRFLVLSNHSYVHFFITYRVLMTTIAVYLFFVYDNAIRHIVKAKRKK
ncbi:hypothetical protein [Butyrivibrio sp. AD3002]|uniref:hypothetical protein n=1 Tax=Butyrivibrio sp. AD3002 TaxID=1280670 RepID=UPI0003B5B0D0|nr:hypothetical protein [Butyrivibrio sp. AD3002]